MFLTISGVPLLGQRLSSSNEGVSVLVREAALASGADGPFPPPGQSLDTWNGEPSLRNHLLDAVRGWANESCPPTACIGSASIKSRSPSASLVSGVRLGAISGGWLGGFLSMNRGSAPVTIARLLLSVSCPGREGVTVSGPFGIRLSDPSSRTWPLTDRGNSMSLPFPPPRCFGGVRATSLG